MDKPIDRGCDSMREPCHCDCEKLIVCSQARVAECEARLFCEVSNRLSCEVKHAHSTKDLAQLICMINRFLEASAQKEKTLTSIIHTQEEYCK